MFHLFSLSLSLNFHFTLPPFFGGDALVETVSVSIFFDTQSGKSGFIRADFPSIFEYIRHAPFVVLSDCTLKGRAVMK